MSGTVSSCKPLTRTTISHRCERVEGSAAGGTRRAAQRSGSGARVRLRTSKPLAFDPYARNRSTGSFILIDEATNDTVGAGMIVAD